MRVVRSTCGIIVLATLTGLLFPVSGAQPQAKATAAGDATRGQALFNERCAICHYDQSTAQKMGPGLKGIYARGQFANGRKVDDAAMIRWIENGGKDMPPMKDTLKPGEIRALVSYLRTL
jgi:mono/diheme cytochrome c family protein